MDFTVTADARELADAAHDVLSGIGRTDVDPVSGHARFDPDRWSAVAELGLPALRCPDPIGFDLGLLEAALVAEHVGAILLPEPVLDAAAVAGMLSNGDHDAEKELLARIVEGEFVALDIESDVVDGQVRVRAPFMSEATSAVAVTRDTVFIFDTPAADETDASDPTRVVGSASLPAAAAVSTLAIDPARILRLRNERTVLIGAELVGAMHACLDQTLAYLLEREQFGQPIGSFQAVKHQCADAFVAIEQARALTRIAAISIDGDAADAAANIAGVAAFVPSAAVEVAGRCLHLFGAMGFAWETGIHLFLKRGHAARAALGDHRAHQLAVLESITGGSAASA